MLKKFATVTTILALLLAQAHASDKTIEVINNSSHTIYAIQATNTNDDSYGEAINHGSIAPGESQTIDLEDGSNNCMYDMRSLSRGGYVATITLNACKAQTWTVED